MNKIHRIRTGVFYGFLALIALFLSASEIFFSVAYFWRMSWMMGCCGVAVGLVGACGSYLLATAVVEEIGLWKMTPKEFRE